jgi:Xaa-Pro aminopeptidase
MVKSPAEIERIRTACRLGSEAFALMPERLATGDTEREAAMKFRSALAEVGVDSVPFLAVCSGEAGYDQIIVGSTDKRLEPGHILFMDLGATWDGYFCDFDRNFAVGPLSDEARTAHELIWQATEAGIAAARPGATTSDLWRAMVGVLETSGPIDLNVGRLGHGLGMQLTEPPSNTGDDATELVPGMVMTIEPGFEYAPGRMIVHEENVVITGDGCEILTSRAPREMWSIGD